MSELSGARRTGRNFIIFPLILLMVLGFFLPGAEAQGNSTASAQNLYEQARQSYYSLIQSEIKRTSRTQWINCIDKFQLVIDQYPKTNEGYKATFTTARLYHLLAKELGDAKDIDKALGFYWKLLSEYSVNRLNDDALLHLGETYIEKKDYISAQQAFKNVLIKFPQGDQIDAARKSLKEIEPLANEQLAAKKAAEEPARTTVLLEKLEYSTQPDSVQITVETEKPVSFSQKSLNDPDRIYFNFENTELAKGIDKDFHFESNLLMQARLSQFDSKTSRLVLDIPPGNHVEVVARKNDSNVIIDVSPGLPDEIPAKDESPKPAQKVKTVRIVKKPPLAAKPIAGKKPSQNEIPVIVIDPGHGGKDDGAKGQKGLLEKHVNLDISLRVKKELTEKYKYKVIMTRDDDTFIPLKGRGDIANQKEADLFVSIHANAAKRKSAKGIETYYLGSASSERALSTAARENGELVNSVPDDQVQKILASLISTTKINDSARLAGSVQNQLHKTMSKKYSGVNDLGVKEGPFFVLHDTNMPSILVEVGFISNLQEEARLKKSGYLDRLAGAIAKSIYDFMKERAPTI